MNTIYYSALLTFGKDHANRGVLQSNDFIYLSRHLTNLFTSLNINIRYRGWISNDRGKNVAPRAGIFSQKIIDQWVESLILRGPDGSAKFEIFDSWSNASPPNVYLSINSLDPQSNASSSNNITVAVSHQIKGLTQQWPKQILETIRNHSGMFYGFFEKKTEWDLPWHGSGPMRGWLMDVRYSDFIRQHYTEHKTYSLRKYLYKLHGGNVVSQQHLKTDIQTIAKASFIEECIPIGKSLWYVTTNQQLLKSPEVQSQAAELFNMFTPDDLDI